ncbi:hypothetical protein [Klebsiella phage phiKp_32]|nr:hypothetical protein [Klebsiella phage phiKp_32]
MAKENVVRIPLYNLGNLSCVGYREGCGYNVKVYWGDYLLASKPNLTQALDFAYIGVRLFSPTHSEWLTNDLRLTICESLIKARLLIDGNHSVERSSVLSEGFLKHWKTDESGVDYYLEVRLARDPGKIEDDIVQVTLKYDNDGCSLTHSFKKYASVFNYKKHLGLFKQVTY